MKINGFKINIEAEDLHHRVTEEVREVVLIDEKHSAYAGLSEGDKKALKHLVNAAKIMNDVALEMDHPLNLVQKQALEVAAAESEYAADALKLFNMLNGVAGSNGVDKEPVEIFEGVHQYEGRNFYPTDISEVELAKIINKMLDDGKIAEVQDILSARTMVRRDGDGLKAIDYTEYFADEFSEIANELECAAHYTTDDLFKDYLGWQAQAFLQNNEEMDILADKHWAKMQETPLEFTVSRENYDDKLTPTLFADKELCARLSALNIKPVPKDMLGVRVGVVNKEGTALLLKFKDEMMKLASLMPFADQYTQNVGGDKGLKQTMVDADIAALTGDYALCRGGITTAQNLPNNDKPALKRGGGRRNQEADHLFVIGHENGHSLGPDSSYQTALGIYQHIIEEHKADMISATMMPEYVKAGIISEEQLKKIYATWIINRHFLVAFPNDMEAHRVADLIEYNFLNEYGAFWFDTDKKLHIDFDKMKSGSRALLTETIRVQLSKSPETAKEFVDRWTNWGEMNQYIADFKKQLGIKPYIEIQSYF